jgi:hypothetical protein
VARAGARATATRVARAEVAAGPVRAEVDADRSELDATSAEVADVGARLDELRAIILTTTGQIDALRTCVAGVARARADIDGGRFDAAVASLQAVVDACRAARAATGTIDPTVRFPFDFPDPYVVHAGDGYFAYATNSAGGAVQLLRSADLQAWSFAGVALDRVPAWAVPGATWAPSVVRRGGGWVLYYAVRERVSGRQCISAATAAGPAGPFVDGSRGPMVCELDQGGSIDTSPFVAPDGSAYLLWKSEGETAGGSATLRGAPLAADGRSLAGVSVTLLGVSQGWEGRTVEAPSMAATPAGFVLLYSANRWDSARYAVGAATCSSPLGPCRKVPGPILASSGAMVGPGGAEAFVDAGGAVRVAFHAWQGEDVGYPEHRYLHIGRLVTDGGITVAVE